MNSSVPQTYRQNRFYYCKEMFFVMSDKGFNLFHIIRRTIIIVIRKRKKHEDEREREETRNVFYEYSS